MWVCTSISPALGARTNQRIRGGNQATASRLGFLGGGEDEEGSGRALMPSVGRAGLGTGNGTGATAAGTGLNRS